MRPTAVRVDPVGDSEYRVRTTFAFQDQENALTAWGDQLTTTVYAVRVDGRWMFSNALPRATADWHSETVGPITYVVAPGLTFDEERARRAVAFADTVSRLFDVPSLEEATYYMASSLDSAYRIVGVEFGVRLGTDGGFSRPVNYQVFSGIPDLGEDYRHEVVHLLLQHLHEPTTSVWASEGVTTWLAGTSGLDFSGAVARLRSVLELDPSATLTGILTSPAYTNRERNSAAAVLAAMVHEVGGIPAVREFYATGPDFDSFVTGLEQILDWPWDQIAREWRRLIRREAPPPGRSPWPGEPGRGMRSG